MSLTRLWIPSPNYSGRGGSGVRLVVLHTTEGAQDIHSLGNYFKGNVSASSHVGTDNNSSTTIGEYVKRPNAAWTVGNANSVSVNCEQCTPSGAADNWTRETWFNHKTMLDATAAWVAEECAYYNIPIRALTSSEAQGTGRGVCQHSNLGSWGGGHHDCGSGFPMDYIIQTAIEGTTPPQKASSGMTSSAAYDNSGRLHLAAIDQHNHVCYRGPNGNWYPINEKENVLSGCTIDISGPLANYASGEITITYTRDSDDKVCTWQKGIDNPEQWRQTVRGGSYQ